MNPVHFQGLNCYHDCIISIANYYGLNYSAAFAALWSETDFSYDPYRKVYLTKRMLTSLDELGARVENLACLSREDVDKSLSPLGADEFTIVGMDAFYIPWNQFYQTFRGPHYFIARNADEEFLHCIDPTYGRNDERIARSEIIAHAFDVIRVHIGAKKSPQIEAANEAKEIVRVHPGTRRVFLSHICGCSGEDRENIILMAKYTDAMICNRYLYRFFLENQPPPYDKNHLLLNRDFFSEWKAVKNGLYKAAVSKSNGSVINDVCDHFNSLIDAEISMAEKIIQAAVSR